ncbi:hypothetical protein ACFQ0B_46535 [Nonomuraea thailandensis]
MTAATLTYDAYDRALREIVVKRILALTAAASPAAVYPAAAHSAPAAPPPLLRQAVGDLAVRHEGTAPLPAKRSRGRFL